MVSRVYETVEARLTKAATVRFKEPRGSPRKGFPAPEVKNPDKLWVLSSFIYSVLTDSSSCHSQGSREERYKW